MRNGGLLQLLDKRLQIEFLVLTQHIVHTLNMGDFIGLELGITAGNDQDRVRMLTMETMNHLAVLMISGIGNGTGVNDTDIRLLVFFCPLMTTRQ